MLMRRLSPAEIETLLAALKCDNIDIDRLRPWLWRRGWQVPPRMFWPIDPGLLVSVAVLLLFSLAMQQGWYWVLIPAVALNVLVRLAISLIGWGDPRGRLRDVVLGVVSCVLFVFFIVISKPIALPPQIDWPTWISIVVPFSVCCVVWLVLHGLVYWRRRLPGWGDYVDEALAAEQPDAFPTPQFLARPQPDQKPDPTTIPQPSR